MIMIALKTTKTAKPDIIPEFTLIDAALHESPVKPKGYFWLVSVEVVTGDGCNGLHIVVVEQKDLLVHFVRFKRIVEKVVHSGNAYLETRLVFVDLERLVVLLDGLHHLLDPVRRLNNVVAVRLRKHDLQVEV